MNQGDSSIFSGDLTIRSTQNLIENSFDRQVQNDVPSIRFDFWVNIFVNKQLVLEGEVEQRQPILL